MSDPTPDRDGVELNYRDATDDWANEHRACESMAGYNAGCMREALGCALILIVGGLVGFLIAWSADWPW
jgi:predicted membrane-bound mannosyltransferase